MKRLRNRQLNASRALLAVTGLIVTALAVLGLLLTTNAVANLTRYARADEPVLNPALRRLVTDHTVAAPVTGAVVALVLVATGLVWLRLQIPPIRRQADVHPPNADAVHPGHNVARGRAMARALTDDLETAPTIHRAQVELAHDANLVRLRLDVADDAPTTGILDDVVLPAVDRLATVAGLPQRPELEVDLRPVEPEPAAPA